MRVALGITYNGSAYEGWQSQLSGNTVQDKLELALAKFSTQNIRVNCSGRTDAGVHGLMQVVHFDTPLERETASWVRGTNAFLPQDIAVQWARVVPDEFHSRGSATARRYVYVVLESPVKPSVEAGRVGWVYRPLDGNNMRRAATCLLGVMTSARFVQRSARPNHLSNVFSRSTSRNGPVRLTGALSLRPMPFCTT